MAQVRVAGKVVDVDDTMTADTVLHLVLQKLGNLGAKDKVRLRYKGKPLAANEKFLDQVPPDVDVYECDFGEKPKEVAPAEEVLKALQYQLREFISTPPKSMFLLICTGSYLNTDKGLADARQQQCPDDIVKHCDKNNLELLVLLVDPNFGKNEAQHQLYHYPPDKSGVAWHGQAKAHYAVYKCVGENITIMTFGTAADFGLNLKEFAKTGVDELGEKLEKNGGHLLIRQFNGDIQYRSRDCPALGRAPQ
jgi:hypothetical protein